MNQPIKPCLGGFCGSREKCQHYAEPDNRHRPSERLCEPGLEQEMFFLHIKPKEEVETT